MLNCISWAVQFTKSLTEWNTFEIIAAGIDREGIEAFDIKNLWVALYDQKQEQRGHLFRSDFQISLTVHFVYAWPGYVLWKYYDT